MGVIHAYAAHFVIRRCFLVDTDSGWIMFGVKKKKKKR